MNPPVSNRHRDEIRALVDMEGVDRVRAALNRCGYTPFQRVPPGLRDEVLERMLNDLAARP